MSAAVILSMVVSVAISPDGRHGLIAGNGPNFGDAELSLWDLRSGELVRQFEGHTQNVRVAVFSPDGRHILSGSQDGTIRLWDVGTGNELRRFPGPNRPGGVQTLAFSPDGKGFLADDGDHTIATLRVSVKQAVFLTAATSFGRDVRLLVRSPGDHASAGRIGYAAPGM